MFSGSHRGIQNGTLAETGACLYITEGLQIKKRNCLVQFLLLKTFGQITAKHMFTDSVHPQHGLMFRSDGQDLSYKII